jgi:hypothetical protein
MSQNCLPCAVFQKCGDTHHWGGGVSWGLKTSKLGQHKKPLG